MDMYVICSFVTRVLYTTVNFHLYRHNFGVFYMISNLKAVKVWSCMEYRKDLDAASNTLDPASKLVVWDVRRHGCITNASISS